MIALPRSLPFVGAVCLFFLAGCDRHAASPDGSDNHTPGGPKKITIACIPKAIAYSYWQSVRVGAERAGRDFGVAIDWQGPLNDGKVADQIGIFNNLAASGVDGILLSPCDDRALLPPVRSVRKRGLPVVIVDSELDGKAGVDYDGYIGTNNHDAGVTAARTLARAIGDSPAHGGTVAMVRFTEGSASSRLREEAFIATLTAANPKLKIVEQPFTDGSMAGAQHVAEAVLNNYVKNRQVELDGIFACTQPSTEGTYTALKTLRDEGIAVGTKFVGFDESDLLNEGLQNGTITALVVQDTDRMGYLGVKTVLDAINRQPVERRMDIPVTVKTRK